LKQKDEAIQKRRADDTLKEVVAGINKGMRIFRSFKTAGPNAPRSIFASKRRRSASCSSRFSRPPCAAP
jgi:hypothetical protein